MKLAELARVLGATPPWRSGSEITGVEGIEKAHPGQLTLWPTRSEHPICPDDQGRAVMTEDSPCRLTRPPCGQRTPIWRSPAPLKSSIPPPVITGDSAHGRIDPAPRLARTRIGAYAVIGAGVVIGPVVPLPYVVIYPNAYIGKDFLAHAQAVVREACRLATALSCRTERWWARTDLDSPRRTAALA